MTAWEPVIGLEVHVQLATESKIFSNAPVAFGAEPNANAKSTCVAMKKAMSVWSIPA